MSLSPPRRGGPGHWMFAPGASPKGRSGRQTKSGAFGSERLVAGEHVPDRHRQLAGDVDLGDLGPALFASRRLLRW